MDLNRIPEDVKLTWSDLPIPGSVQENCKPTSEKHYGVHGSQEWRAILLRDQKQICPVSCSDLPIKLPRVLHVTEFQSASLSPLPSSKSFIFQPCGRAVGLLEEWKRFLTYLRTWDKIAVVYVQEWQLFLRAAEEQLWDMGNYVEVFYTARKLCKTEELAPNVGQGAVKYAPDGNVSAQQLAQPKAAQMHPDYLQTLRQTHNGWLFGAIAELVDNARDAKATRLDISVKYGYLPGAKNTQIPMLCIEDNGTGMNHEEIMRMIAFGHKKPDEDDPTQIGRFGVGFKTGAMKLGKDTIVFTQGKDTRSIALLSSSFNEGKDVLEVPVVTYHKQVGRMEYDLRVQTKEVARANEKAVIEYSPFDKYGIGHELSKFDSSTGTRIYVYNLEKWGPEYCLQWDVETSNKKTRDIIIGSRRVRTRPGQTSKEVPLDYSLHAYLEVMFLEPKMIIYVQGSQVKTRRLAKSLNKTEKMKDTLLGKEVELTLGRSQVDRDSGNCGIFLYWHGRLIEAYKRVGNMVHSADWGRGVVGVIDTTSIMEYGKGRVGVLNNKQGFEDSEAYAALESWLGVKSDEYWEAHEEDLEVTDGKGFTQDLDWVQCNKCLKWRVLKPEEGSTSKNLPDEWFCYMAPFKGSCKTPEDKVEPGVITVGTKRNRAEKSANLNEESTPDAHGSTAKNGNHKERAKNENKVIDSAPGRGGCREQCRTECKIAGSQSVPTKQSDEEPPLSFVRKRRLLRQKVCE